MSLPAPTGSPYRIGFVCLGNICRSPMADVVLSHLVDDAGLAARVSVASCGTGDWHVGQPMDTRAATELLSEGYDASAHRAKQFDPGWLDLDLLLAMDRKNLADISHGRGSGDRIRLFRSFDPLADPEDPDDLDVPDPYYGNDDGFAEVLAIIERTCRRILTELADPRPLSQNACKSGLWTLIKPCTASSASTTPRHNVSPGENPTPRTDEFSGLDVSVLVYRVVTRRSRHDAAEAARRSAGPDAEDFPGVADQYRRELTAHCYRMTGSVYDAEDMVQETYLRAWKAYDDFEGRSSVRTWLYRIATNVCLTNLENKGRRPLPTGLGMPGAQARDELVEATEVPWLQPVPDVMVDVANVDPALVVGNRDAIRLAFVAALQHLPPRQRAVLVLRDVLRWSAKETAAALETSVAAVNSALQRAHAQLAEKQLTQGTVEDDLTPEHEVMLERYVQAFWAKDVNALVTMLAHDAVWEMPPFTAWYTGAQNIADLIDHNCPGGAHDMPMIRTSANGQPAFGLYMRQPEGHFEPFQLQVLQLLDGRVTHVVAFFERELFETFGLPTSLPASYTQTA